MDRNYSLFDPRIGADIRAAAANIATTQLPSGEIPWYPGHHSDPWDHIEAAMGLSIGGYLWEARRALLWSAENQQPDGSWYATYRNGRPEDGTREANLSAYFAVGLYHFYLVTGDHEFLKTLWPTAKAALEFALSLQAPGGEIYWAISPKGRVDPMALLTGSSSICFSLKCGLAVADLLGEPQPHWRSALNRLEHAIRSKPSCFNMTKSRFSMDWFYPVLCGAITAESAGRRIEMGWKKFVINGQGVRCVSDKPWVTIAETCELALALAAMGNESLAKIVFNWVCNKTFEDGSFWCGYTFPDMTIWPEDKISWTNGVALMTADALYQLTPASRLFIHQNW